MRQTVLTALILAMAMAGRALAQEEITLIDGSVVKGSIDRVEAEKVVVRDSVSGALLEIPLKYLSPFQQYRVRTWNVKPDEWTAERHKVTLHWCLDLARYDDRLKEVAQAQAKFALEKGASRREIDEIIQPYGYMISEKGELKSPEELGLVWDEIEKEWVKPEVLEQRQKERRAAMADELKKKLIIGKPSLYDRISPASILEARADYKKRKVRFWGHFHGKNEGFGFHKTDDGVNIGDEKYVGLILLADDFSFAFVEKSNKKVAEKLDVLLPGERVQVFGTVMLTSSGFIVVVDDVIAD